MKTRSTKNDPKTTVLSDKKLLIKISSFLRNPFTNFAKVSRGHWRLFRELTPAPFLADRFQLEEAMILKGFDEDSKFFFYLNRKSFMTVASSILFKNRRSKFPKLSENAKKVLILGAYRFMIRDEYKGSFHHIERLFKHLFIALNELKEYQAAIELFLKYPSFYVPSAFDDEEKIHNFLDSFSDLRTTHLMRFKESHIPSIFSFLFLKEDLPIDKVKFILDQLEKTFFSNVQHFSALISSYICDKLVIFMKNPTNYVVTDETLVYKRNLILIDWVKSRTQGKTLPIIKFLHDMNFLRFNLSTTNITFIENMIEKWLKLNPEYYNETILNVALQTKFSLVFVTAANICLDFPISPEFKFALRKRPEIIKILTNEILFHLHSRDHKAVFETLSLYNPIALKEYFRDFDRIELVLSCLTAEHLQGLELDFDHFTTIFMKLCSGAYDLDSEKRLSLFKTIFNILSTKNNEGFSGGVLIEEQFLISLAKDEESLAILKRIEEFKVFWRIEAMTLVNLLKNAEVLKELQDAELFNYISVNLYDLVSLVTLEDWTDKLCPLFTLNAQTQFERVNGMMWPVNEEIVQEIDSVLEGKRPVLDFLKRSNSWTILPRLAFNSLLKQINTTSLLKLWSRSCIVTFIIFVPDNFILPLINRDNIIKKWLRKQPTDEQFNWRFISVFLDESISLLIESKTLTELEYNYLTLAPFLMSFGSMIKSKVQFKIHWDLLLSGIKDSTDFEKIARTVSLYSVQMAFENEPQLKTKFKAYYQLLFDFDFVCLVQS